MPQLMKLIQNEWPYFNPCFYYILRKSPLPSIPSLHSIFKTTRCSEDFSSYKYSFGVPKAFSVKLTVTHFNATSGKTPTHDGGRRKPKKKQLYAPAALAICEAHIHPISDTLVKKNETHRKSIIVKHLLSLC